MSALENLKKPDLISITRKLDQEVKELKRKLDNKLIDQTKPYVAVSELKINGITCAVKVQFGLEDIIEKVECPQGLHMSAYKCRQMLAKDVLEVKQTVLEE